MLPAGPLLSLYHIEAQCVHFNTRFSSLVMYPTPPFHSRPPHAACLRPLGKVSLVAYSSTV